MYLQAIVKEDELMSRLEMLENQLQVYSKVSRSTVMCCLYVRDHRQRSDDLNVFTPVCVLLVSLNYNHRWVVQHVLHVL